MSSKSLADELTTVAGVASAVAKHALTYGIDIAPICRALEIDPESFQSLTSRISIDRLCRLLEACALLANDDAFGLTCVRNFVAGASGPFGYGVMSAPTGRDFVHFVKEHTQYVTHTSCCQLEFDDRGARLTWTFAPIIVKRDQYVDMALGLLMQRARDLTGQANEIIEIELERPRAKHPHLFRELLARKVSFECRFNSIRFSNAFLEARNPKGDRRLHELMDLQCRAMRPEPTLLDNDFIDQVRKYLYLHISEQTFALGEIAPYFGLSERTFQRRLADHNTSLNELRDDVRRDISHNLLTTSDLPISEICYRLGYSAPSAFTRSVTRWFGITPRDLREQKSA